MDTENLTYIDVQVLERIEYLRKQRRTSTSGPFKTQSIFDGVDIKFDTIDGIIHIQILDVDGKLTQGTEHEIENEIYNRCGSHDLRERCSKVSVERLRRVWAGTGYLEGVENYPPHRDRDFVDNLCATCGRRGLRADRFVCSECRNGE